MTEQEVIDRGQRIAKILSDSALGEAFANVRQGIFEAIEKTPIRDNEGLHELRVMLKLLTDVRAALETAVRDGKVVEFRVKQRTVLGRAKDFFTNQP